LSYYYNETFITTRLRARNVLRFDDDGA